MVPVNLPLWARIALLVCRAGACVSGKSGGVTMSHHTETQRATAEAAYRAWVRDQALSQTMYLIAVEGRRPASTLYQYNAI